MKNNLNFFIEIGKLKKIPRTGWVLLDIKNPETIGEHMFRVAIMNWILAEKKRKLDIEKIIKMSLSHDLCEVYAGDITPFWGLLPKNKKERRKFMSKWIRLPKKETLKRIKIKREKEKKSLEKLIKNLNLNDKKSFFELWWDYEKLLSGEGKFVRQGDQVETLMQALEYWGGDNSSPVVSWWEGSVELVDDPIILKFMKDLEKKFYKNKKASIELDLLLNVSKLKTTKRNGWIIRDIKNPETIAGHNFRVSIMSWVLGKMEDLNSEKIIKTSLIFNLHKIYSGDETPYNKNLLENKSKMKKALKDWPKFSKKKKENKIEKEKISLKKVTKKLPVRIKKEIETLWIECKKGLSREGRFVREVNILENFLQAAEYWKVNKKFPISAWQKQADEEISFPTLLEFKKEIEKLIQKK